MIIELSLKFITMNDEMYMNKMQHYYLNKEVLHEPILSPCDLLPSWFSISESAALTYCY